MMLYQPFTMRTVTKYTLYRVALAETWTEVWGDEVGALAPKIFFCRPPKNVTFGGDGGGLTYVFVNFNI